MSTSPGITFNVIISGTSVSGAIDTKSEPVRVSIGNSDRTGYARFVLQNKDITYTNLTVSGNATCQVDVIHPGGATQTIFRGTVEIVEPQISVAQGSIAVITAYDYAQELLGAISPDARVPSLLNTDGTISLTSGDQGFGSLDGMDLSAYVSGRNSAGARLNGFLSQYFGRVGDPSGTNSGSAFSFKSYISGATTTRPWRTFYYPDASGGVLANDNNSGFVVPIGLMRVKREFAWDVLRKLTRNSIVIDSASNRVPLEMYVGVSGDIHVFTSGSYEFLLSGTNGQLAIQYYVAGTSGATLNNIVDAKIPSDTSHAKSFLIGWFPAWSHYPLDTDEFTDFFAYSGALLSGTAYLAGPAPDGTTLSGNAPAAGIGMVSIMATNVRATAAGLESTIVYTFPSGQSVNLSRFNAVANIDDTRYAGAGTTGLGVSLNYSMQFYQSGGDVTLTRRNVRITDSGGVSFIQSGLSSSLNFPMAAFVVGTSSWASFSHTIYNSNGTTNSGTGQDGGWAQTSGTIDLTSIRKIEVGAGTGNLLVTSGLLAIWLDNLYFSFAYPFSPVFAFNSGAAFMYGRRYAVLEYPYEVNPEMASGVINTELNARMGSKQVASFVIKDNPLLPPIQLRINPGQAFVVDAPSLGTGSGQTFYYWRAIEVKHEWSASKGFITSLSAIPWYSGTVTAPNSNFIDYRMPMEYTQPPPSPPTPPWYAWMPHMIPYWRQW